MPLLLFVLLICLPLPSAATLRLQVDDAPQDLLASGLLIHNPDSRNYRDILRTLPTQTDTGVSPYMWLVAQVHNPTEHSQWTLRIANALFSHITLYQVDATQSLRQRVQTGRLHPAPPTAEIGYYLPLSIPPGETHTLLIWLEATPLIPRVVAELMPTPQAQQDRALRQFFATGVFGIIAALVFYNALLGVSLRRDYYLWYTLHGVCLFGYFFTVLGPMARLLGYPDPALHLTVPLMVLAMLFGLLFHYRFLDVPLRAPRVRVLYLGVMLCLGAQLLAYPWLDPSLRPSLVRLTQLVYSPLILVSVIVVLLQGFKPARYVLLGWGILIGVFLWASLSLFGVFRFTAQVPLVAFVAVGFEMITLAMALGESIRQVQRDKAQQEAQLRANRLFIATLSHEIRNPLAALMGLINLLDGPQLEATQRQAVQQAQRATGTLLDTLDTLLLQFRQDPTALQLRTRDFSLHELLEGVISIYQGMASDKGIRLYQQCDPALPKYLHGDPVRLRQVLLNLVGNSIKYSHQGTVSLEVQTLEQQPEALMVRFSVCDEGPGINAHQARIFAPFERVGGVLDKQAPGVGLGLNVSQRIITAMGGHIQHRNRSTGGSEFYFSVRLLRALDRPMKSSPGTPHPVDLRILLVDDDPLSRQVDTQLLSRDGQQVSAVATGRQALDVLSKQHFDAVIMDIQMGDMDGLETTRAIRQHHPHIAIIGLTAGELSQQRPRGLEAGMNTVLGRPLDHRLLYRLLSPPTTPLLPLLDPQVAERHQAVLGLPDWQALLAEFQAGVPVYLEALEQAHQCGDDSTLEANAHRLAGAAGALGLARLAAVAGELEQHGDHEPAMTRLMQVLAETLTAIKQSLPDQPGA